MGLVNRIKKFALMPVVDSRLSTRLICYGISTLALGYGLFEADDRLGLGFFSEKRGRYSISRDFSGDSSMDFIQVMQWRESFTGGNDIQKGFSIVYMEHRKKEGTLKPPVVIANPYTRPENLRGEYVDDDRNLDVVFEKPIINPRGEIDKKVTMVIFGLGNGKFIGPFDPEKVNIDKIRKYEDSIVSAK